VLTARREQTMTDIRPIEFPMRMAGIRLGTVNCYLLAADTGFVLVDTAFARNRGVLDRALEDAGCRPANLSLVVMTHGDLDHTGNGAYLRGKYRTILATHHEEFPATESGDATASRRATALPRKALSKISLTVLSLLIRPGKFERFRPDVALDDGYDLSGYGLDATVVHLPGHSRGSIGILTGDGDLFCGDLLWNMRSPGTHPIVDDPVDLKASVDKLKSLKVNMIYPGHGKPFSMESFTQTEH
jgi:glyoxylase-like metal-dependent hydrolase (beta-lactamase superfamily II)